MRSILRVLIVLLIPFGVIFADESTQTDWAGGPDEISPLHAFDSGFETSAGLSWLAIDGQLSLSSEPLETSVKHLIATGHNGAYGLFVVDFDRDGDVDVVGATDRSHEIIIWFNDGLNPVGWTEHIVDSAYPGGTSVHPADIDGDGDLDVVAAAQTPGNNITWWRNDGGDPISWSRFRIERSLPVACNLFVADIDGDGDLDVSSTSWSQNFIGWWRNDGQNEDWARILIDDQFATAHSAFAFDADGDGDNDIVGTAANAGNVVLFFNDLGDGTSWSPQIVGSGMNGVRYATAADIDGDGRLDMAAAAFNGQVFWWRNNGGNPVSWTQHTVDQACIGGHYLIAADLNGDGNTDLLVAPTALHSVYGYLQDPNDPDGWERFEIDRPFNSPLTTFPADIDGDGDLDVVGTSPVLGEIAWWEISKFVPSGTLESSVLDLGQHHGLHGIRWSGEYYSGANLSLSFRTSNDMESFGPWSPEIRTPSIMLGPWDRYFQYRVLMTSDGTVSPILEDVTVFWNGRDVTNNPGLLFPATAEH